MKWNSNIQAIFKIYFFIVIVKHTAWLRGGSKFPMSCHSIWAEKSQGTTNTALAFLLCLTF